MTNKTKMNKEYEELLRQLDEAGMQPKVCDMPVALYDARVPCGIPTEGGDVVDGDYLMVPRELFGDNPTFFVTVKGNSMKDAGLQEGDQIQVRIGVTIHDGDIVLASIDGAYTVKTYCDDDKGSKWLVPQNDDYEAILLTEEMDVRLMGRVINILKQAPRTSYSDCMKKIRQARSKINQRQKITEQQVDEAIIEIATRVKHGRQWYAVYRAMVERKVIEEGEYGKLVEMVDRLCPEHGHRPVETEMSRMCVDSFRKNINLWESGDAPVGGKRFVDYLIIGQYMLQLLR